MEYFMLAIILLTACYTLSFAKYCWKSKNKLGAVGAMVAAAASIVFPLLVFIYSRQ